ncbi:MAG: hypothetical protein HOV79_09000 [Hamadaea sp.]|nr:hypothetical protein [Hamadaea sp.]
MTQLAGVALWLAVLGQTLLIAVSAQIPARLGWRTELPRMEERNRALFLVATGYIVFTYLAFAVLTAVLHDELVRGDRAALALAGFIGLFWLVRLVVDAVWFRHRMWPAGRRFVVARVLLDCGIAAFAATYLGLVAWHLLR